MTHALPFNARIHRWLAIALAALLMSTALVAGPLSSPASAVDESVGSQAEFEAVIATANAVGTVYNITFTNNIYFDSVGARAITGESDVNILGDGFAAICAFDEPCGSFLSVASPGSLTIEDLTIEAFPESAVVVADAPIELLGVTFQYNATNREDTPSDDAMGAALRITGSDVDSPASIQSSHFLGNYAGTGTGDAFGAAIYVDGDLGIYDTVFDDNYAGVWGAGGDAGGAAIYALNGEIDCEDCTFAGNQVFTADGVGLGGAIAITNGEVNVYDTTFEDNYADGDGGAISMVGSSINDTVYSSGGVFIDNSSGYWGGAIHMEDGTVIADSSEFRENYSSQGGGAIHLNGAVGEIYTSLFAQNEAFRGGALSGGNGSSLYVDSTTLTDNEAYEGGAISVSGSALDLVHVTMARNVSDDVGDGGNGGGQIAGQSAVLTVGNSVIVEPVDSPVNCALFTSTYNTDGYNVSDDTTCGLTDPDDTAGPTVDAELGPLKFNGGPTHTMLPDQGSILINAITGPDCVAETEDQRELLRPRGAGCDIGAVETLEPIYLSTPTAGGLTQIRILNAVSVLDGDPIPTASLPPTLPAGVTFPYGGVTLELEVWDDGWPVDIDYFTPAPTTSFWKYLDGSWAQYTATYDDQVWTFRLIDGGAGDEDGVADSVIVDPWAAGVGAAFTG